MTLEEITTIIGPIDDALIVEINRTGASVSELAEAWAWLNADKAFVNDGRSLPSGRVEDLVALLEAADPDDDV